VAGLRRIPLNTNRFQLGFLALAALFLLRVGVGWHFYKEGVEKVNHPEFSSAGFFRQASGPLQEHFHELAPHFHDWKDVLATGRRDGAPLSEEEQEQLEKWKEKRDEAVEAANAKGEEPPVMVPPFEPYSEWVERVSSDWKQYLARFNAEAELDAEQAKQAGQVYSEYKEKLLKYFQTIEEEVAEYRHELHRLEQMKSRASASDVPYQQQRIAEKEAEVRPTPWPWIADVQEMESQYQQDLRKVLSESQQPLAAKLHEPSLLERVDRIVPYWHIVVGVGLVLGLFSRISAFGAAVFLGTVVATQLWWVPVIGSEYPPGTEVYYQVVEFFAALVLMTIPTGRFLGLDQLIHKLFSGCCRR